VGITLYLELERHRSLALRTDKAMYMHFTCERRNKGKE